MQRDSVEGLIAQLRQFAAEREWQSFHTPKNLVLALVGEVGELAEHFQWLTTEQTDSLSEQQRAAVALELADVLLYLLQLSDRLGVDILAASQQKIRLNAKKYPALPIRGRSDIPE